ncbi:MAG: L-aspartate oxidase [Microbacterium sp.]|uniref:L-aspartate oxidase n=1 Tax=Microbacterium sp. TaxID=51671 RepID=UPI002604F72B|nr:L-aspartate oxidase [Microbacterium sp.]MCX6502633.1 L-aspartate oxidase [Microbacterium sp.]
MHAVIVGSGIAGIVAALHAARTGVQVTLVTKDVLDHANTHYAQGGIAAVMFDEDSADAHLADTLAAGAGLSDEAAVRVLVDEGPDRIRELIDWGVGFDRNAQGELRKGLEAAHSYPRILHAGGDATGAAIEHALVAAIRASGARVIEHAFLVDIVVRDGRAAGVTLLVDDRDREVVEADAVVLATGGAGQLYAYTTNPLVATGDGIAAALRAGAAVADLEFVQFHPTVLAGDPPFLVSEAVRGEGAVLIDDAGRRFAFDAHPDGELAPRDVVARSIARTVAAQDGHPVRLDATALGAPDTAGFLAARFPTIDAAVRAHGFDWSREPIPVTPAAHYLMGGVATDLRGRTTLPGLYAVGEVARTGVHGANRLASNSLLEGAVFGARVGDVLAADATASWPVPAASPADAEGATAEPGAEPFSRAALQQLMWREVGLVRDADGLARAARTLTAWAAVERTPETEIAFEDENLLLVAQAVVAAAQRRTTSVGAHFRADESPLAPAGAVREVAAC